MALLAIFLVPAIGGPNFSAMRKGAQMPLKSLPDDQLGRA